jgi:phage/plasmid-like protein (TIGR03299 family)
MAHELDRFNGTRRHTMFSVRQTPWHREGVVLAEAPTLDEAMVLSGTNFEVGTRPVYLQEADGSFSKSVTGQAIVRLDRAETIGEAVFKLVGDDYRPLQNRDAFGVLEPLLDKGVAKLETGGTLRGGRDVWMLVRFDVKDPVVQEVFANEVVPYGLITNNHSGQAKARVKKTPIRVVCANTLGMAFNDGWEDIAVSHRGDAKVRMVEAAEKMFGAIIERYRIIAEQYKALKARILTVEEFTRTVLDTAAPLPEKLDTLRTEHLTIRGYDARMEARTQQRNAITRAWTNGRGHVGDHSAWEAYNGAVEVIDHNAELFRTRGSRVAAILSGRLVQAKDRVLDAVATLCIKR